MLNFEKIKESYDRIKPYINKTPILISSTISKSVGGEVYFKCENFQKIGAFKARGALNAVFSLDDSIKSVVTHSSGNHAAAIAYACKIKNIKSYIVMPSNTPEIKKEAVKNYGGEIIYCENTMKSREAAANRLVTETNGVLIHPFNDYNVMAGQGTIAIEIFEKLKDIDYILTPVSGGGLISGVAIAANYLSKKTKVIGVEPENVNDAYNSLILGSIQPQTQKETIADGLKANLGTLTFPILQKYVDIVLVSEKEIVQSMKIIFERLKIVIEPSSATVVAAVLFKKIDVQNKKVALVLSGGNIDLVNFDWGKLL